MLFHHPTPCSQVFSFHILQSKAPPLLRRPSFHSLSYPPFCLQTGEQTRDLLIYPPFLLPFFFFTSGSWKGKPAFSPTQRCLQAGEIDKSHQTNYRLKKAWLAIRQKKVLRCVYTGITRQTAEFTSLECRHRLGLKTSRCRESIL